MEEKIYDRQVTKTSLSLRVVDEKQIGRHYTFLQLQELFTFTPAPPPSGTTPREQYERPSADIVLCKILDKLQPQNIVKYHTHDSLLQHVFDEELSEEEQKAAWDHYNAQKELESRAYNIGINMMSDNTATPSSHSGATPTPGLSSAVATSQLVTNAIIWRSAFQLIQQGVEVATAAKNSIDLRNHIVPLLNKGRTASLIKRYQMACTMVEAKVKELHSIIPKLKEVLANPFILKGLSMAERQSLEKLRDIFLQKLKEIDEGTKVNAPDPHRLLPVVFN